MTTIRFIPSATGETSVFVPGQAPVFKAGETVTYEGFDYQIVRVVSGYGHYHHLQRDKHMAYVATEDLLAENSRPMAAADLLAILLGVGVDMDSLIAAYVESKESEAV